MTYKSSLFNRNTTSRCYPSSKILKEYKSKINYVKDKWISWDKSYRIDSCTGIKSIV